MESFVLDPGVFRRLTDAQVSVCLIGAAALSAHGFARYTSDVDLLTLEGRVLVPVFWTGFVPAPEIRQGGLDDPLRGVVRWSGEIPLDLIVGVGHAAGVAIQTAVQGTTFPCPVATPLALTLLKLEAGGPQDRADILSLAHAQRELNGALWLAEVPTHIPKLSREAREAWSLVARDLQAA